LDRTYQIILSDTSLFHYKISVLGEQSICFSIAGEHQKAIDAARMTRELYEVDQPENLPYDRFIYF